MRSYFSVLFTVLALSASTHADAPSALPARIDWPEFARILREQSPRLRSVTARAQIAHAEVDVALRIPNPVLSYLGYGRTSGTSQAINSSQHQIQVEQEIPLWGQRRARRVAADAGVELAEQSAKRLQNEVFAEARLTFVALLVAQARHACLSEAAARMTEQRVLIEGRVKTGLLGGFELGRSALEERRFLIARDRARIAVERLAGQLAAFVGAPAWQPEALGELGTPSLLSPDEATSQGDAPDVLMARAHERAALVNVDLIGRERLPPLTLTAGTYLTTDGGSTSLLGGLSMPIPSFDTGSATQERARRESQAASVERASVEAETAARAGVASRELNSLRGAYSSFREGLPEQLKMLRTMAEESYRAGTVALNVLLDAQRAEVEVQLEMLDTLLDLLVADVRARALAGRAEQL